MEVCRQHNQKGGLQLRCEDVRIAPYIMLDKATTHPLRLVREDGSETSITMNAGMHIGWIWANGIWLVGAPIGWAVDLISGSMKYFGSLDVGRAFRDGSRGGRSVARSS